jgi:hypothetical protein
VLERPAAAERARDVAGGVRRGYLGHHVVHDLAPGRRWGGGEVSSTGHTVGGDFAFARAFVRRSFVGRGG